MNEGFIFTTGHGGLGLGEGGTVRETGEMRQAEVGMWECGTCGREGMDESAR